MGKGMKRNQHHCPQCKKIAGLRCVDLGHMVMCEIHDAANAAFGVCHQCEEEARRAQAEKSRENERRNSEQLQKKKQEEEEAKAKAKADAKAKKYEERIKRASIGSEFSISSN